jgi:hypothetical protein
MAFDTSLIQQAAERLAGYIVRMPVLDAPQLDEAAGCRVFVKADALQRIGSFNIRGALNKMLSLDQQSLDRGFISIQQEIMAKRLPPAPVCSGAQRRLDADDGPGSQAGKLPLVGSRSGSLKSAD